MMIGPAFKRWMRRFARDERGVITPFNLLLTVTCCAVGAVGLDVTRMYEARTHLQVMADVGAHAALMQRVRGRSEADAKADAVRVASDGVPTNYGPAYGGSTGPLLTAADITFGTLAAAGTGTSFTPLPAGSTAMPNAARVVTNRADDNPVGSFLFRIIGLNSMNVRATALYATYYPACLSDGFVAAGIVDIQSNNSFLKGFCLHSNVRVETNNQNLFELGTVVSMPDWCSYYCNKPDSIFNQNMGLREALRNATYDLRELDRLRQGALLAPGVLTYAQAISTLGHDQTPWYLTSATALPLAPGSYGPGAFSTGRIHSVTCSGNQDLTLTGGTYSQVVIMTNCEVKLSGQVAMEDTVLYTSSTSDKSISASSGSTGLVLGKNDHCAARGGATILTRGGMHAAAKLQMYGGQVRLLGDFEFASGGNAEVTGEGVSVMAGGEIDGTTHMNISGCPPEGMDQDFETPYFRLAG